MGTRATWILLAVTLLGVLPGCGSKTRRDDPVYLSVRGPTAVDVNSFNGDVKIVADPRYEYAMVEVRRRASHGAKRGKEASAAVDRVQYSARMVAGDTGPVLEVTTWTADAEPWFLAADVRIYMPDIQGVKIRANKGKVEAIDVTGEVDIELDDGDVWVLTQRPMTRSVRIINGNGDIAYRVPEGSTGRFDCRSSGGRVRQRINYGDLHIFDGTVNDMLVATLDSSTNPVTMRTTDGDINISVIENPTDVGAVITTP